MCLKIIVVILFLQTNLPIFIKLTSKKQMITRLNLKEIHRPQWVYQPVQPVLVLQLPALLLPQGDHVDSVLRQDQEVIRVQEEAFDLGFPELIAFMPVLNEFWFEIEDEYVEGVDADALVADDDAVWGFLGTNMLLAGFV